MPPLSAFTIPIQIRATLTVCPISTSSFHVLLMSSEKDIATEALSECLLKQIKFCVAGVVIGGVIGVTKKIGVVPMVTGGVAGSFVDLGYGYNIACKEEVERQWKAGR